MNEKIRTGLSVIEESESNEDFVVEYGVPRVDSNYVLLSMTICNLLDEGPALDRAIRLVEELTHLEDKIGGVVTSSTNETFSGDNKTLRVNVWGNTTLNKAV